MYGTWEGEVVYGKVEGEIRERWLKLRFSLT